MSQRKTFYVIEKKTLDKLKALAGHLGTLPRQDILVRDAEMVIAEVIKEIARETGHKLAKKIMQ